MNNIERIFSEVNSAEEFATRYFDYLSELLGRLDRMAITAFVEELLDARTSGNTVFIAGNGGSAATSLHMVNDIGMDVLRKARLRTPFRVISLAGNTSLMTAVANDCGYDELFVQQLRILYQPGDRLLVISASGNSPNLIVAAKWVKAQGGRVFGLLGFDGGELAGLCDTAVHAETPRGEYGPVEDIHMVLDHMVSCWLQLLLRSEVADE